MNEIQIFQNQEFGAIRTMSNEQGDVMFCAKDVAEALGYKRTRDAITQHVDGFGGNENLTQPSRATAYERLELLVRAMTTMECSTPYKDVDVEAIREGFDLAFPGVRKVKKKRIVPREPADVEVSKLPEIGGTTLKDWDEYWDW